MNEKFCETQIMLYIWAGLALVKWHIDKRIIKEYEVWSWEEIQMARVRKICRSTGALRIQHFFFFDVS